MYLSYHDIVIDGTCIKKWTVTIEAIHKTENQIKSIQVNVMSLSEEKAKYLYTQKFDCNTCTVSPSFV